MITDLTKGSPSKLVWNFSIPLLLSVMFQQLYNIVDSIVAGRFINENALAAVGASYPITMIFISIATGSNIGCSVIISRLFGGKEYAKMKTAVFTSLISIIVLGVILTVVGFIACNPLLLLLNTPQNILADADAYLRIYIGGLLFLLSYNIFTGIFISLGDSKTPLYLLITSSLLNIILDLVFVINFGMGVTGVAWATFIAQGIASIISLVMVIVRLKLVQTTQYYPKFSFAMLGRISTIAIPSILQQSFISVGNLFIQGIINSYGSSVIAGYAAAMKLNTFAITSFATLANGVSGFTSQNIGAGKLDRVSKGFKSGVIMCLCVAVPFTVVYFGFSSKMMEIFLDSSNLEAISVGTKFLRIVSPFYVIISIKLIADGVLRGAGAMVSFMIATLADLILRVVLAFILSNYYGTAGIWCSWPIGWAIGVILSGSFYASGVWKKAVKNHV